MQIKVYLKNKGLLNGLLVKEFPNKPQKKTKLMNFFHDKSIIINTLK